MKQSTTFAQVATNQFDYLSSALRANTPPCKKHSSSRKFLTLSISLRLLLVLFLTLTASTAWGAVSSGSTYSVSNSNIPSDWSMSAGANTSTSYFILNTNTAYIQTDDFCVKSFSSIKLKARKYGGPSAAQLVITVEWIVDGSSTVLGTISPTSTSLSNYTISSPTSITPNQEGYVKISCKGASSSKGSGVSEITITYTEGSCSKCKSLVMSEVTATAGDGQIILAWNAVSNANDYEVTCYGGTVGSITGTTTKTCTITGLTNGTSYNWSVMPVGNGTIYCEENTPATGSTTPNATYSITYHDKDGAHSVDALGGSALLEVLPNNPTSCDIDIYPHFVGWSTTDIPSGSTTEQPTLVSAEIVNSTTASKTYYAVWSDVDPNAGGGSWEKATSISVGDKVVFVHDEKKRELTGVANDIGTATEMPNGIEGTYVLTVEAGTANNSYSFKNENIYLSWSSGNKLYTSDTKNNASSWTINTSTGGNFKFANVGTTTRILQFNSSDPRWACYASSQSTFQIYKQSTAAGTATYITTCATTYNITANLSYVKPNGSNPTTVLETAEDLNLAYEPMNGWNLPSTISVTMGGNPLILDDGYTWDKETGKVWIVPADGFTGDIVVTINGWQQLATPTNLSVTDITPTSATLSWNAVENASSYTVELLGENKDPIKTFSNLNATTITISDLKSSTNYILGVVAVGDGSTYLDSEQTLSDIFTTASATCTVTYNANGGIGTLPSDETEYTNGATVTVLGNYGKLTKDGYAFTGWNTKADGSGESYKDNEKFIITANTTLYAQWCKAYWKLVTDESELENDTRIVIAAKDYNFALSTEQKTNNRGQAAITKKYNTVTFGTDVQTLTLIGLQDNKFALYTGSGYLYAASSSNNYLKTKATHDNNCYWSIGISETVASIYAQGDNTHDQIKYNHQQNGQLFSCYESSNTSMSAVVIYKEVCVQDQYNVTSNLTNATAKTNPTTVAADATSLTLNYSANTGYLLPETITVKMGGVELVSGTDYTWNKETGALTITVTGFYGDIDVKIVAEEDPCYGFAMSAVNATSTTTSITLTWTAVDGATGYNVKIGTGELTAANGLTHTFDGLSPKTSYNWEVQAVKEGEGFHCEASKTGSTTTQKETFTVSWIVNGNTESPYATESVMDGNKITTYPNDPSAPSGCNKKVFVGWTKNPINTPTDEAPAPLYKQMSDVPAITETMTLHAVWADKNEVPGEKEPATEKIISKDCGYNSGAEVESVTSGVVSIAFNKGTNNNVPKYYSTGEAIRTYGGNYFTITSDNTITSVELTFASGEGTNAITTDVGTYSEGTWTGSANSVKFTVSGSSGHRRISQFAVTYLVDGEEVITYSAYTTLCDECTPSESLVLSANASTADLDINGKATIAFSTTGGNGGEITYAASPKTGVTWDNGTATFTKAGEYSITASQGKNGEYCPTTSNTVNVTITAIPHLYFVTEPANPIVFDPVECGGNTRVEDKKSVSVQAYNLAAVVTAQVTGPYKIARTSGAPLNEYTTSLTLRNNITDGKINGDDDVIYILSFPPAGSSEPTEGTLTFKTTNGNTLTVNLSTPTITCTPRTLTFNDRGIKTTQEYYAGTEVPEPATPTGVCGEYEFDGWALAKVESGSITYEKVTFPFTMPANNQTVLHAVYRYTEGPTNEYELVTEIESGKNYVIAAYDQSNGDFALTNQESNTDGKFNSELVECDANNIITTDNSNIIWTVTGNDEDGYEFYNSAVQKYIEMYRYDGKSLLRLVDNCVNPFYVNIEKDLNNDVTVDITSPEVDENYNVFSFYQELFNVYTRCDYNIYFYEQTATPLYTTTPDCHPSVTLISDGEVYVTATNGRGIMAATPLTLTTTDLAPNTEIAISSNSNDIYFSTERNTNFAMAQASQPQTSLTLPTNEGGELETQLYIHYKPSADGDGTPAEVIVTADVSTHNPPFTAQKTIHVRNLPAKFVIATKAGATWYALPANMNGATNPAAVVIEVDETTMTATAPNTTPYTLWPVATINGGTDRYKEYGERLRFAAVNNGNKGLWANNADKGTTINNNGAIVARGDNPGAAYEWKVTTKVVDGLWQYTLQTDQANNQKNLCYRMNQENPAWGTYASNEAQYQLYFLPIKAETTPFDYQVVEWYPNKVLIHTTTAFSSLTAKIAGEQVAKVQYTAKDANQYEITGLPLMENPAKALTLEFVVADATHTGIHTIPVMLSGGNHSVSTLAIGKGIYNYTDLVVRDGATLTVNGAANTDNTFYDVTIYPTSKISVPSDKKLTVHSLTFFGGIDDIYDGEKYTTNKYGVPQLSLKGTLGKTVTTMDYIMRVNLDQMYQVGVPYNVDLSDVTYWDGSAIELGDELYVSAYDGQARANLDMSNTWRWEVNFAEKVLKAGVGYTISAEPQVENDDYSILRMPMKDNIASGNTEESKQVPVIAYANQHSVQIADNHKGWNYLSNPYMTAISGGEADSELVLGYLKETGTGPWEWVNDEIRYVTIPHDDGEDYNQKKFSKAVLKPFKSFFVQIATDGELSFALTSRQNAPARYMEVQTEQEVEFEILLSNDKQSDNTGLLIAEQYSPAYEINADLEKMIGSMSVYTIYGGYNLAYNAISPINASEWIPIGYIAPAAGEYTFRLDDIDKIVEQVEHVYLIDYEANNIVDLMDDEYEFTTDKEQNNNRFAINVVLSQDKDNTTTGLDIIQGNNAAPIKFIYHDKMYIQSGGVIYDATGKQVTNINK